MPLTESITEDAKRLLVRGAGRAFEHTVRQIYESLGGNAPRESPVVLVQRLLEEGKVTAEAAMYLFTLSRALDHAGAFKLGSPGGVGAITQRIAAVGALLREKH